MAIRINFYDLTSVECGNFDVLNALELYAPEVDDPDNDIVNPSDHFFKSMVVSFGMYATHDVPADNNNEWGFSHLKVYYYDLGEEGDNISQDDKDMLGSLSFD